MLNNVRQFRRRVVAERPDETSPAFQRRVQFANRFESRRDGRRLNEINAIAETLRRPFRRPGGAERSWPAHPALKRLFIPTSFLGLDRFQRMMISRQ
jgi:hypothetical protein